MSLRYSDLCNRHVLIRDTQAHTRAHTHTRAPTHTHTLEREREIHNRIRVLVVDDDAKFLKSSSIILSVLNYKVCSDLQFTCICSAYIKLAVYVLPIYLAFQVRVVH